MNPFRLAVVVLADIIWMIIGFHLATSKDWGAASNFMFTLIAMPILVITFLGLVWSEN